MKKSLKFLLLFVLTMMIRALFAQAEVQVPGLSKDGIWPIVNKVLKDNNLDVDVASLPDKLETQYKEYNAGLIKNRAKLSFAYKDGILTIAIRNRQTLNNSGWADAVFPSKKADEKLLNGFADQIKAVSASPEAMAGLTVVSNGSQPAGVSGNSPVQGKANGINTTKKPSLVNAKQLAFDNEENYFFSEGMCAIKKNNLWGFIDSTGNLVIDFKYFAWSGLKPPHFSCGIAMVAVQGEHGARVPIYIDKKGQQLFKPQVFTNATPFYSGIAIVEKTSSTMARSFQIINTKGQVVPGSVKFPNPPGYFPSLEPFHEGLTRLYNNTTSSYGFINTQGKWVVMPNEDFLEAGYFSEGLAPVQNKKNFTWGYINTKGELKVPYAYEKQPGRFGNGLAPAEKAQGKVGYIDAAGNALLPFNYARVFPVDNVNSAAGPFTNGFAVAYVEDEVPGYAIIDKTGLVVRRLGLEKVQVLDNGWIYWKDTKDTDTWGIVSPEGKDILLPGYFTFIGDFTNGHAYVVANIDENIIKGFVDENFDFIVIRND